MLRTKKILNLVFIILLSPNIASRTINSWQVLDIKTVQPNQYNQYFQKWPAQYRTTDGGGARTKGKSSYAHGAYMYVARLCVCVPLPFVARCYAATSGNTVCNHEIGNFRHEDYTNKQHGVFTIRLRHVIENILWKFAQICVCVCVCVCARARARTHTI